MIQAALLLVSLVFMSSCGGDEKRAKSESATQFPDQILTDFQVEMTRGNLRTAVITADKGVVYRKRDSMIVDVLQADLYDDDGSMSSRLWADSGLVRERREQMIAFGNVRLHGRDSVKLDSDSLFWYGGLVKPLRTESRVKANHQAPHEQRYMVARQNVHLVTKDSVHLWTDTLVWDDLKRTVATDSYVRIVRRGEDTLQGYGLRSGDELKRITILDRVSGRMHRPPK